MKNAANSDPISERAAARIARAAARAEPIVTQTVRGPARAGWIAFANRGARSARRWAPTRDEAIALAESAVALPHIETLSRY